MIRAGLAPVACQCMTEDLGDGLGERIVTHSLGCQMHPEHDCPVSDPFHGRPGETSTCLHCGHELAVSDSGHWYHVGTGLIGWVDDPKDGAHRATPAA